MIAREILTAVERVQLETVEAQGYAIARLPRPLAIDRKVLPLDLTVDDDGFEILTLATPLAQRLADAQDYALARRAVELEEAMRIARGERPQPHVVSSLGSPRVRDREALDILAELRLRTQCDLFVFKHADAGGVQAAIVKYYGTEPLRDTDPLVNLANDLLRDAVYRRITDIETLPAANGKGGTVTAMISEVQIPLHKFESGEDFAAFTRIIKSKAAGPTLQPGTSNVPQDGQFTLELPHRRVDIRVNVMPCKGGRESLWLRFMDLDISIATPERLRMPNDVIQALDEAFQQLDYENVEDTDLSEPGGIVPWVGPQRSGKTTSAESYMVHRLLPRGKRCAETGNPIEREIDGVAQFEINERGNMSYEDISRALKRRKYYFTFFVEGRDHEGVKAIFSAGATGGLTGFTFHVKDAFGIFEKLQVEFGVPLDRLPLIKLVISQRLVRELCKACRRPVAAPAALVRMRPDAAGSIVYEPVGCEFCSGTGYRRELGVFEKFRPTPTFWRAVYEGKKPDQLYDLALREGYRPMFEHGIDRVLEGETSLQEIFDKVPRKRATATTASDEEAERALRHDNRPSELTA